MITIPLKLILTLNVPIGVLEAYVNFNTECMSQT